MPWTSEIYPIAVILPNLYELDQLTFIFHCISEIRSKTRAFFCETVSNPALEICDLETIANLAHENGLPLIADSTFSTPVLCKPFEFGVDIVVSLQMSMHDKSFKVQNIL